MSKGSLGIFLLKTFQDYGKNNGIKGVQRAAAEDAKPMQP